MTEYKCPYCGQDSYAKSSKKHGKFQDWKAVRNHTAKCKDNSQEYMICEYYGPMAFVDINKYKSINFLKKDYPLCSFGKEQWRILRLKNKLLIPPKNSWDPEDCIKLIQEFVKKHNRIPQAREFESKNYCGIDRTTISSKFGSWNKAIEAAGFTPNIQNGYGIKTYGKDGALYDSQVEAYFVDNFLFEKYQYEYYTPYGNGWFYDFYLPELDLYIEINGELRLESYKQKIIDKIEFNKQLNRNFKVITKSEIYKKDFNLTNIIDNKQVELLAN